MDAASRTEITAGAGEAREGLSEAERVRRVRFVLIVTLGLNVAVAAAKIAYGYLAHALSIRADGFHSATDGLNNVVALIGIWIASRPPDRGHPYGHRKFEFFAATLIGLSLLFVAVDVLRDALGRLAGTAPLPDIDATAFWILGVTWAVNLFVAVYEARMGRKLKSPVLESDASHTRSDVLVTAGVLTAVIFTRLGYPEIDVVAAIVVAGFVAWAGAGVLRQNVAYLADAAPLDAEHVLEVVRRVPGVLSAHHVRSRGAPGHVFVDLHIHIPPHLNVVEAHDITHRAMDTLRQQIPGIADVTIHTEPALPDELKGEGLGE